MHKNLRRSFYLLTIVAILFTSLGSQVSEVKAATTIFINEIHYDNTGGDTGEAVEIAGPAGTDLTGWSLVGYNGSTGAFYSTTPLSGTISDQDNGYGTLSFAISGLQNGAPDGIALVDNTSAVVQFLSYEGSFTAADGPANGMVSTDIGVSESGSDPIGESLQMTGGPGLDDSDFTWAGSATASFGAVNTGQSFGTPPPPLVINEFQADPATDISGDANGDGVRDSSQDEFVELVNGSGVDLDISGWTLSDAVSTRHTFPAGTIIPAGCNIVVFGGGIPTGTFGNAVVQVASSGAIGFNNGGDTITVNDGTSDVVTYSYGSEGGNNQSLTRDPDITGATFVEHSTATGSGGSLYSPGTQINGTQFSGCPLPDTTAPTMQTLSPADDSTGVAVSTNLVISFDENVQKGTGNITIHLASDDSVVQTIDVTDAAITVSGAGVIIDPPSDLAASTAYYVNIPSGAIEDISGNDYAGFADATTWNFTTGTVSTSVLNSIVFNEVLPDPNSTTRNFDTDGDGTAETNDEFVEIYNTSSSPIDISGLQFWDSGSDNYYTVPASTTLGANGFVVVVADVAGGSLPTVSAGSYAYSAGGGLSLYNGGDNLVLYDPATDEYIQAIYNGDTVDTPESPPAGDYVGFSATATRLGAVLDMGNDTDGTSRALSPDGVTGNIVDHDTIIPAGTLATPGNPNVGATPPIVINEVDADQTGTDAAEFVELYDGGTGNTALDGLVLVFFNGSDDQSYDPAVDLDGYTTDAGGYFVVCGDSANVPNCDLDITPDTNLIQNGADAVALYVGNDTDFPNDTPVTTTNLIDALVYDTNDGDDVGLLALLNASEPQVNEGSNDPTTESNQRCPNGTGGQRNTSSFAQYAPTAGTANTCGVLPPTIDLELTKTVDNNNPDEGDTIYYTLTVSNVSTTLGATNVVVRDYIPDNTTKYHVPDVTITQGSVLLLPSNVLEWTVGDIAVGGSATMTVQVVVHTGTDGTSFDNRAEVWSANEADSDSTPGNLGASPAEDDEALVTVNVGVSAACGSSATLISAVQGSGAVSPMDGSIDVTIEGVVVGDFQTSAGLSGFFLQEEDADADGNAATSEGIFVFDGASPSLDVNMGDVVRVTGTVDEYYDLTEITTVTEVLPCGTGTATAATVTLPVAAVSDWEQYEGMLVTIPQTLYATSNYTQGRYGEVDLSINGKLDNPTNVVAPGAAANALRDLNDRSRIQLEDGRTVSNPDPAPYIGVNNTLRTGDTIPSLTGVLNYAYGAYEIHPTGPISFTRVNARPTTPPNVGGTVKIASFNVLNYFTTLDDSGAICGPASNQDCRGADNAAEFTRQYTKIVSAITAMDADVIGLMEIENHPADAALTDLVNRLNASAGAGTYAAISTSTIGTDAIKVALIYKPATVTPLGAYAILDSSVDATFIDTKNRPVLAQSFTDIASGEVFTVAVNHLKSKGSDCDSLGDPDMDDGQGNCNVTRTNAATAEVNWLATDPTGSGDPDFILIGDMNAYAQEDPITAIKAGGYTNLIEHFLGVGASSYQFYGEHGTLDHALASTSMTGKITGVAEWHINGDEPEALSYQDYNQAYLYQPNAFRASDHDPVMVGLATGEVPPVVVFGANTIPADGASLTTGPTQIFVEYNKDVLNDGSAGAANNTANYMLVEALGDGFQTVSCAVGPNVADTSISIDSAMYSNTAGFIATLGINGGVPLPVGDYRFFVCGTTSITDLAGLELNGGLFDTVIDFTVGSATELPATGFPQGVVTPLGEQPQEMQYTETVMFLDIPSLGVSTPIVGVPINETGWEITWLGSNAGYLAGTAFPTWDGNTVITGHVWDANNLPGPFANVKCLNYGDTIQIRAWGLTYTYEVRETTTVAPWQVNSALREETYDWVTLVTCEDYQDSAQSYASRRVIRAVLVDVR